MPSSRVAANNMPSFSKSGDITIADTVGGGLGRRLPSQCVPPSLDLKNPPDRPATTKRRRWKSSGATTAIVARRFCEPNLLYDACHVTPLSSDFFNPDVHAAKHVWLPVPKSARAIIEYT